MSVVKQILQKRTVISPIGLDVGHTAMRAAQLKRSGNQWHIISLCSLQHLHESSEPTLENPDTRSRVSEWLRHCDFRGRQVVAGLSYPDVELHAMQLPPSMADSTREQQRQAAHWEIERLMSFDEGSAETDFWRIPESRGMTSTAVGAAAKKGELRSVVELCRSSSLDCIKVDASPCALSRFGTLLRSHETLSNDVWAVLDWGARTSRLIVCIDDTPVLGRSFEAGGVSWSERIASSLSVSSATADRHKCDYGIIEKARHEIRRPSTSEPSAMIAEMIYNVLRDDIETVISELEKSYRYVLQCFPNRSPGPLIMTGGGANMRNLSALLSNRLGIEVTVPSAQAETRSCRINLSTANEITPEPISQFACAIGLAIMESIE